MSVWDFFDHRVCLTVYDEEWLKGKQEFDRVGLSVARMDALPDIGPHQSFNRTMRQVLQNFNDSARGQHLLHLEDDCVFQDLTHLDAALSELPEDWDICYLGCNLLCMGLGDVPESAPERYSEHLFRVKLAWTTHAIGFNRKVVPFILDNQPGFSERMLDNWIGEQLPKLRAYAVAPMVAWQRSHYSGIWSREVDYDDIFRASNEKLR